MRVLLVDDEEELVSALAERLFLRGIEADWVTSGDKALKVIETKTYDLAVLDVKMPEIGGLDLKKVMEKRCPDMKFIFLTGHGSEDDFNLGLLHTGADYYLVKPVKIEVLINKMKEILNKDGIQ